MAYNDEVLADTPVLAWGTADTSGSVAEDLTANNRDGTYANTPTLAAIALPNGEMAPRFTAASSEHILRASETALNPTGDMSLEVWAYFDTLPASGNNYSIMGKEVPWFIEYGGSSGSRHLDFKISRPGGVITCTETVEFGTATWIHIAATYDVDTGTAKLYIDGVEVDSQVGTGTHTVNTSANQFRVGSWSTGGDFFNGGLAKPALYASTLSPTRVVAHYDAMVGGGGASVTSPPADASGDLPAPAVSAGSTVTSPPADATGALYPPVVTASGPATPEPDTPTTLSLTEHQSGLTLDAHGSQLGLDAHALALSLDA